MQVRVKQVMSDSRRSRVPKLNAYHLVLHFTLFRLAGRTLELSEGKC